jgi:hypothetical protein
MSLPPSYVGQIKRSHSNEIRSFTEVNNLPEGAVVSVAADAMAMHLDHSELSSQKADHSFPIFV